MNGATSAQRQLFRLWIAGYEDWHPARWDQVPPRAVAIEPAEPECLPAEQARLFLQGFNGRMLSESKRLWAVALPIAVRYEGDVLPGQAVAGYQFDEPPNSGE